MAQHRIMCYIMIDLGDVASVSDEVLDSELTQLESSTDKELYHWAVERFDEDEEEWIEVKCG